jgi:hypothetical protein
MNRRQEAWAVSEGEAEGKTSGLFDEQLVDCGGLVVLVRPGPACAVVGAHEPRVDGGY